MKRLCVAALSLLLTGPALADMVVRPDYIEMIESYSDTLAEATVIASRLQT
jgi:hypothetical protein